MFDIVHVMCDNHGQARIILLQNDRDAVSSPRETAEAPAAFPEHSQAHLLERAS